MLKIEFSESNVNTLDYERYHHSHPRVQRIAMVRIIQSPFCAAIYRWIVPAR
jgi:hypothetical protein